MFDSEFIDISNEELIKMYKSKDECRDNHEPTKCLLDCRQVKLILSIITDQKFILEEIVNITNNTNYTNMFNNLNETNKFIIRLTPDHHKRIDNCYQYGVFGQAGLHYKDAVDSKSDLPKLVNNYDTMMVKDTNLIYVYSFNDGWLLLGTGK